MGKIPRPKPGSACNNSNCRTNCLSLIGSTKQAAIPPHDICALARARPFAPRALRYATRSAQGRQSVDWSAGARPDVQSWILSCQFLSRLMMSLIPCNVSARQKCPAQYVSYIPEGKSFVIVCPLYVRMLNSFPRMMPMIKNPLAMIYPDAMTIFNFYVFSIRFARFEISDGHNLIVSRFAVHTFGQSRSRNIFDQIYVHCLNSFSLLIIPHISQTLTNR